MAHYGTLRDFRFTQNITDDIRGASLYGLNDDKLGKIDDVIFDHATGEIRYVVVDTGGWLHSKKFVVPSEGLRASAKHEDDFEVDLTKEHIERFPPYNEKDVESSEKWGDYENRYRSKWASGPIMHREATDRNITPTTAQMTQGTGATGRMKGAPARGASAPVNEAEISGRIIPATANEVEISTGPMGIGPRWSNFEAQLRQRRKEAVAACVTCGLEGRKAS